MGLFDRLRAAIDGESEASAEEIKQAENSILIHIFGMQQVDVLTAQGVYNDISNPYFGGIDYEVKQDGFFVRAFTRNWKIISETYVKFKDIKEANRNEYGDAAIDREPDYVSSNAVCKAMLKKLLTDYIGQVPYLDIDVRIGRVTFNGRPR